jgi:hypothetical protein
MIRHGNRTIKVKKVDLIAKIKENKENHVKEFDKAVVAYKEEALRQLRTQLERVEGGALDAKLDLITPVNNAKNYDNILEMFVWEVADEVELEQSEFQEYVQDTTDFAVTARMSNTAYLNY